MSNDASLITVGGCVINVKLRSPNVVSIPKGVGNSEYGGLMSLDWFKFENQTAVVSDLWEALLQEEIGQRRMGSADPMLSRLVYILPLNREFVGDVNRRDFRIMMQSVKQNKFMTDKEVEAMKGDILVDTCVYLFFRQLVKNTGSVKRGKVVPVVAADEADVASPSRKRRVKRRQAVIVPTVKLPEAPPSEEEEDSKKKKRKKKRRRRKKKKKRVVEEPTVPKRVIEIEEPVPQDKMLSFSLDGLVDSDSDE